MKKRDGLWIPDNGDGCYEWTMVEKGIPNLLMNTISQYRTKINQIVHAGGNIGMYAIEFAKRAKNVYVFEPSNENFGPLCLNCANYENIFLFKAALGNEHKAVDLINDDPNNTGTWRISKNTGNTPTMLIDDLCLDGVDIIHLDIEGYELFALLGAKETIERCSPLIAFETLNHNKNYNYEKQDIFNFLFELGYKHYQEYSNEIMFMKFE